MDRLISADGQTGTIPTLLRNTKARASRVIYAGYHRSGGLGSAYDRCADELTIIEARIAKLAASTPGLEFADMRTVFPRRDRTYYDTDLIHPSIKGAGAYAAQLADVIRRRN
ncbi:MAG: SGNH/GDSL hydrolase family protein [Planktomarina sp.]